MVGAGTGIAPFRSFWQERKIDIEMTSTSVISGANGNRRGEAMLYFGCRRTDHDEVYRSEIDHLLNERVLNEYHAAYSREPNREKVIHSFTLDLTL